MSSAVLFCFVSICSCTSKYVGTYCEYPNPCLTGLGRCQNGGTCKVSFRNDRPSISCICPIGYSESLCEIPVKNACDSSPCKNDGSCNLKTLDEYTCACANGYSGRCTLLNDGHSISGASHISEGYPLHHTPSCSIASYLCYVVHHILLRQP